MSDEQEIRQEIRRTLAEFMGWTNMTRKDWWWHGRNPNPAVSSTWVPNYMLDLDAMHDVEAELCGQGYGLHWITELRKSIEATQGEYLRQMGTPTTMGEAWADLWYRVAHATAEQRARAAYAVIKQQKERA